ncbi:SDR family NAD(P)-dependent oxidoreductase [Mycolicibacterium baixiangningiae]|uniref:SDR family NAD(P)-dependent oxidoreductase n=1 Tax=Mycolicibacterium baixiangningiae TaxID=2761578 RepID=UPI0018D112FF|nr:SDR family NAD(P)-dependent oxidoreductase [Mycolicibacterium baixiangningiae]
MSTRSLVLTGATSGLGLGLARRVVGRPGWQCVLLVRNAQRGDDLRELLGDRFTEGFDQIVICEQSSLDSVRAAAVRIGELVGNGTVPPLSTVVLNAAVLRNDATELSVDGIELTVATNLFGPHTLLAHLSPCLAPDARILIVGSPTIQQTWFQRAAGVKPALWKPLSKQCEPSDDGVGAYARTKLGLFYLSCAAARMVPWGMSAAYFDPGVMPGTNILRERHRASQIYWLKVLPFVAWTFGGVTVGRGSRVMARYVLHEKPMGDQGFLAVKRGKRPPPVDLARVHEYFTGANDICAVGPDDSAPWWHRHEALRG